MVLPWDSAPGKRSQYVFKWPAVHVKHNNMHIAISGVLGDPVEGH
jgi:hypothetical protein